MKNSNLIPNVLDNSVVTDPSRRRLAVSLLSAYTATLISWAWAQPIANDQQGAFFALSAILAGRQSPDTGLGSSVQLKLARNSSA